MELTTTPPTAAEVAQLLLDRGADVDAAARFYGGGVEAYFSKSRHNLTFGGDLRRVATDIESQQNPRGGFAFTGAVTGSDLGDFLLGVPTTSSIAFGNADKSLRAYSSDLYIVDDWRFSPTLTMQVGARWEYETPLSETLGRLGNLAFTSGFASASSVVGNDLIAADRSGIQPRIVLGFLEDAVGALCKSRGHAAVRRWEG